MKIKNVFSLFTTNLAVIALAGFGGTSGAGEGGEWGGGLISPAWKDYVSVDSVSVQANGHSYFPAISADGRYVAFHSYATNLVAGDTNVYSDVFLRDTVTGVITRVSVDSAGAQAFGGNSRRATISADGRYVAFQSDATNLVAGDTNAKWDVFLHDTVAGTTTRVSVDSAGVQTNGISYFPAISADGKYVAFQSDATNLVAGDTNAYSDVFLHDTVAGTTTRVSVDSAGAQANSFSSMAAISADGRYVTIQSNATNLVAGDTNTYSEVFLRDTVAGTTTRVSVDSAGVQANSFSGIAAISADGRYVVFRSSATNLVAGDTNPYSDVFLRDTVAGTTKCVSVGRALAHASYSGGVADISAGGGSVAF